MSANSPSSSPSMLTYLRQYRFQRKSNFPESSTSNEIIAVPSTSENEISIKTNHAIQQNIIQKPPGSASTGFKRIRVMDSSSESESNSPSKKLPLLQEMTPALQERRFRNMVEMFPEISNAMIRNTLIKHKWNEERCRDELIKYDPETADQQTKDTPGSKPTNGFIPNMPSGTVIRRIVSMPARNLPPPQKKVKRRREGSSSDDSDYDRRGNNDRVFDSDEDSDVEITNELSGDKKKVFEFLSTSKLNELISLSGCSQKKAEAIIAARPFRGWIEMVDKFQANKNLSTDLLNATQELLSTRNNIQKLMKKCTGLAQQLEAAVGTGAGVQRQPALLNSSMKLAPYQLVGVNWLAMLHKLGVSGILADEMGLGKTVQVIAFLAHLKETKAVSGTHLIVVPASTLDNWKNEFERWCPSMRLSMYYGNQEERRCIRINYVKNGLDEIDVILTTYTLVTSCPEEKKMFRVTQLDYVIFDEAHMLKNMATQRYDNLMRIKSKHRLLLTGTPLQNNLIELMSLLCFVMPHMFEGKTEDLKCLFQKNSKVTTKSKKEQAQKGEEDEIPLFEQSQISQAKRIMKPFVLRRLKRDVLKDLPKKTDKTMSCPMSEKQQTLYKNLIMAFSNNGIVHATNEHSGMSMMMDMRKLANHPLLMRYYYEEGKLRELARRLAADSFYKENNPQHIYEDLSFMSDFQIHQLTFTYKSISGMKVPNSYILDSGKFNKLDELLPCLKKEGHRVLIFSQFTMMLDIIEPYLRLKGYQYLRLDGSTAVTSRQDLIDQYNRDEIFVFLLSTKAGGLGINLTAADTVIIHDIDFNPYNDKQAEDRCHRMGQTRPVTIYRLLSAGSIEEGIYQVAQDKLNLERDVTRTDENEPQEMKNVVRLLTLALGLNSQSTDRPF